MPCFWGRPEPRFTGNDPAVGSNKNWVYKAEFPDGGGDLRHLLGRVGARIDVATKQPIDGPAFDLDIKIIRSTANKIVRLHRRPLNNRGEFHSSTVKLGDAKCEMAPASVIPDSFQ